MSPVQDAPEIPGWRDASVRGIVSAPVDCDIVRDLGNRRPGVDGFVGLVNFASGDALPAGPVAVQLRFGRDGEEVPEPGRNVLLVSVDGIVPGTTRTATDSDRFTFTIP